MTLKLTYIRYLFNYFYLSDNLRQCESSQTFKLDFFLNSKIVHYAAFLGKNPSKCLQELLSISNFFLNLIEKNLPLATTIKILSN